MRACVCFCVSVFACARAGACASVRTFQHFRNKTENFLAFHPSPSWSASLVPCDSLIFYDHLGSESSAQNPVFTQRRRMNRNLEDVSTSRVFNSYLSFLLSFPFFLLLFPGFLFTIYPLLAFLIFSFTTSSFPFFSYSILCFLHVYYLSSPRVFIPVFHYFLSSPFFLFNPLFSCLPFIIRCISVSSSILSSLVLEYYEEI